MSYKEGPAPELVDVHFHGLEHHQARGVILDAMGTWRLFTSLLCLRNVLLQVRILHEHNTDLGWKAIVLAMEGLSAPERHAG